MVSDTEGQWLVILRDNVVILRDNGYTEGQWLVILRDNG